MPPQSDLTEYDLPVSPEKVLAYVNAHTEAYRSLSNLSIERDWKLSFWSKISGNSFRIRQKNRARGYTHSYAPWLCGKVTSTEQGSRIQTWFEIDGAVHANQIASQALLTIMTIVTGIVVSVNIFSGNFYPIFLGTFLLVAILWAVLLWMKRASMALGQKDKNILTAFVKSMVATLNQ